MEFETSYTKFLLAINSLGKFEFETPFDDVWCIVPFSCSLCQLQQAIVCWRCRPVISKHDMQNSVVLNCWWES